VIAQSKLKNWLHFSLIFGLSAYFGLGDGLSERLIQKVKSPNVDTRTTMPIIIIIIIIIIHRAHQYQCTASLDTWTLHLAYLTHTGSSSTYLSDGDSEHSVPDLDLPTSKATNRSSHDSRSPNDAFHIPNPKLGMHCLPTFRTQRTTVRSDASWRHFCLNAHSLHSDSLATGHLGK